MRGTQMKGQSIHWRRRSLGGCIPWFYSSSIFPRGGGIFDLIWFKSEAPWHLENDRCSLSARLILLEWQHNKQQVAWQGRKVPSFPASLCLLAGLLSPKRMWFLLVGKVPTFIHLSGTHVEDLWFPATWPLPSFLCLYFLSYLPAVTKWPRHQY